MVVGGGNYGYSFIRRHANAQAKAPVLANIYPTRLVLAFAKHRQF